MKAPMVVAVVVTYNPGPELAENLMALRDQCTEVVVVDNGSANGRWVAELAMHLGVRFIPNERNLGVATALNQGRTLAIERGAEWLATFDQDSLLPFGAVQAVLAQLTQQPDPHRYGIVTTAHCDRGIQRDYHHPVDIIKETEHWRILRSTITSGSLIRCDVLQAIGPFDERLFIDAVDLEFCLRMRRRGWLIGEAREIVMQHSIGAATQHRLLGVRLVCTHHSAVRRYYITRNMLEVCVRHVLFDPRWALKGLAIIAAGALMSVLREQDKLAKLLAVLRGFRDFGLRRFGSHR
jgi:rhamnosyltransferase